MSDYEALRSRHSELLRELMPECLARLEWEPRA
jgi:hypothetical protein